ncbi:MAG: cell division protein FtsI/penicillin-binding protein 2, partial [Candidatus Krumholzibacteriia bacterium]
MPEQRERQKVSGRFRQLRYVIVLAGIVLAARVVHLQVFRHAEFKEIADGQWGK